MGNPTGLRRFVVVAVASFAFVMILIGPAVGRLGSDKWRSDFWAALFVQATYQTYDTAEEAIKASDAVILGQIVDVSLSREVQAIPDWGIDGILTFATVEVRVDRVLAGQIEVSEQGNVTWEAFVPTPNDLERMKSSVPTEPVLLLVSKKTTPKETLFYDLLNPESYFVNDGGNVRSALGGVQEWSSAWERRDFDALVDSVETIAGETP